MRKLIYKKEETRITHPHALLLLCCAQRSLIPSAILSFLSYSFLSFLVSQLVILFIFVGNYKFENMHFDSDLSTAGPAMF